MVRIVNIAILCLALAAMPTGSAYAQPYEGQTSERSVGPRRQVATIVFAGLAGAILGLSTLSFYGRPQEKMLNIAYGAAVGIIIGASYTTYKAATLPRRYEEGLIDKPQTPEIWNVSEASRATPKDTWGVGTGWSWSF